MITWMRDASGDFSRLDGVPEGYLVAPFVVLHHRMQPVNGVPSVCARTNGYRDRRDSIGRIRAVRPIGGILMTVAGRLFQARMWRQYAMRWDGNDEWVRRVLRIGRTECLRRCRVNIYLASRLNRRNRS